MLSIPDLKKIAATAKVFVVEHKFEVLLCASTAVITKMALDKQEEAEEHALCHTGYYEAVDFILDKGLQKEFQNRNR